MGIITTIVLYVFLAMEAVGVLVNLSEAKKPRPEVEPAAGCLAGLLVMICASAPTLLLMTTTSTVVRVLAVWLAVSVVYDLAQLIRQIHGVRGPRTPLSTLLHSLWGLANMAVVLYILVKG